MKVAFQTLGCRVNVYDSEAMIEMFINDGYELVDFNERADVYVINSCTVTNTGEKKSRQYINRAKKTNPEATVAVVGCYSQVSKEEVMAIPGVDVVLGSRNKSDIVFYVHKAKAEQIQVVNVSEKLVLNSNYEDLLVTGYEEKTRAFLKIQDGCNRFCSYCIIPYARGGLSSKNPGKVLQEINNLAQEGFKEIILSGIHIASYGQDLPEKYDLLDLLEEIERIDGISRVRIGSIEPMFFKGQRMERILKLKKLCPHFHLSLQSGSEKTLRRMNRRYSPEEYRDVVKILRDKIENISITTDIIVGFPGETEEEFKATYDFLEELKLNKVHTFKYSKREGTPAFSMDNQVPSRIKDERSTIIMAQSDRFENDFIKSHRDKVKNVLFESGKNNIYMGFTPEYIRIKVESEMDLQGRIIPTKLIDIKNGLAWGEIET
ncbi:MAG: tRNA (N(6)-L-threonylcarbamoyladenosine(37)-C(2))-methylthiotransferase MtaB [Clostridium sp.]|nr:tRNA (N(6)-L-threonylcarbamoyladenosine(37)-C(2))-methylthiotransferase MtaB [Clostridium sp.]